MAKNNKGVKIIAFLALFGIIIGIIGTGLLIVINGGKNTSTDTEESLTPEQYKQIQDMIKTQGGTGTLDNSGKTDTGTTNLGENNNTGTTNIGENLTGSTL